MDLEQPVVYAAGTKVDGKLLEPGRFIDLKDGEEIEFGDGKRYTIKYGGSLLPTLQCPRPSELVVLEIAC